MNIKTNTGDILKQSVMMALSEIQSEIDAIEDNNSLSKEINFISRSETIDRIDFHIIDRIDQLQTEINPPEQLFALKRRAYSLKRRLEEIDADLFLRIRTNIQSGIYSGTSFKGEIDKYLANSPVRLKNGEIGFDNLDLLVNGIFPIQQTPLETKEREAEMVFYQKTPARIIFELAEKTHFTKEDVFYDLGSGLGQVCILVNLLSGVKSTGIEFEPEFCKYANISAKELNLKNIKFINSDARSADYSDGTVFFMYTPFTGQILQEVLEILRHESLKRKITLFTYGPCTIEVANQNWLISASQGNKDDIYRLYEFRSHYS